MSLNRKRGKNDRDREAGKGRRSYSGRGSQHRSDDPFCSCVTCAGTAPPQGNSPSLISTPAQVHINWRQVGSSTGGFVRPESELPHETATEPFVAYKRAHLTNDGLRGVGVGARFVYKAEDTAVCLSEMNVLHKQERVPVLACGCGFYALKEKPTKPQVDSLAGAAHFWGYKARFAGGNCLLEVELYGKVIVYDQGYRAEKQRVLSVYVDPQPLRIDYAFYKNLLGTEVKPISAFDFAPEPEVPTLDELFPANIPEEQLEQHLKRPELAGASIRMTREINGGQALEIQTLISAPTPGCVYDVSVEYHYDILRLVWVRVR